MSKQRTNQPSGNPFPTGNVNITGNTYHDAATEQKKFYSGETPVLTKPEEYTTPVPFKLVKIPNVSPVGVAESPTTPATVDTKRATDIESKLSTSGIEFPKITATNSDNPDVIRKRIDETIKDVNTKVKQEQKNQNNPVTSQFTKEQAEYLLHLELNNPVPVDVAFNPQLQKEREVILQNQAQEKAQKIAEKNPELFDALGGVRENKYPLAKMWNIGTTVIPTSIIAEDEAKDYIDNNKIEAKGVDTNKILESAISSTNIDYKSVLSDIQKKSRKYEDWLNSQSYQKQLAGISETSKAVKDLYKEIQAQRTELSKSEEVAPFLATTAEVKSVSDEIEKLYASDNDVKAYFDLSKQVNDDYDKLTNEIAKVSPEVNKESEEINKRIDEISALATKDEKGLDVIPQDLSAEYEKLNKRKAEIVGSIIPALSEKIGANNSKIEKLQLSNKNVTKLKELMSKLSEKKKLAEEQYKIALKKEKEYRSTDKKEIEHSKLIEKYNKQLSDLEAIKSNSWFAQMYDKYKGNLNEQILLSEYTNAVNAFNYSELQAAKLVPALPDKLEPKLRQLLQSSDYLNSSISQKIVALSYYWHHNKTGLSQNDFMVKMKPTIRIPVNLQALIASALQLKKEMDDDKKVNPELFKPSETYTSYQLSGVGVSANTVNVPGKNQEADYLLGVLVKRIVALPHQSDGIIKDFIKGIKESESKDWIPFLGIILNSNEMSMLHKIFITPVALRTPQQQRVVDAISALNTVSVSVGEMTGFNIGNKAFPNLIKMIAEFTVFNSVLGTVVESAVESSRLINLAENIIRLGAKEYGISAKGVEYMMGVGEDVSKALGKGLLISGTTVPMGGLGTFYEITNQHVHDVYNYETCTWEQKEEFIKDATSKAKVFLDVIGTHIIQNSTMYLGHFAEKLVAKGASGIVNTFTKDFIKLQSIPEAKIATKSFLDIISTEENKLAYAKLIAHRVFSNFSSYASWIAKDGKQVFTGQLNGAIGLTSISLYNHILISNLERSLGVYDNTESFDVLKEFKNAALTLAPLGALHISAGIGFGSIGRGVKLLRFSEYTPTRYDFKITNTDITHPLVALSFINTPFHSKSVFTIYKNIVGKVLNLTTGEYTDQNTYSTILANIDSLAKKGNHKLSVMLGNLVSLRDKFENSGNNNGLTFKEYYESFKKENDAVEALKAQVIISGKLDIDYFNNLYSILKFERTKDELDNIKAVYDEYNNQRAQGLISENKSFIEFSNIEMIKLKRIENSLMDYITNPGTAPSPNFEITDNLIDTLHASDGKKDALRKMNEEARDIYNQRDRMSVEGIHFVYIGGDNKSLTNTELAVSKIDIEPKTDASGNVTASGFSVNGLIDSDGTDYSLKATDKGTVTFSNANIDTIKFMDYVAMNMDKFIDNVRYAIFLTLHKNDSLSEEQKYQLLSRVYNNLAENAKGTDISSIGVIKQLAVIDKALKLLDKTFTYKSDEKVNPLDGKVVYNLLKSRFNIEPETRTYILDPTEYITVMDFLNGIGTFSNVISIKRLEALKDRIIIGDYEPIEKIIDDGISSILPVKEKKVISEKDIRAYLKPLLENENFTPEHISALTQIIRNTANNLVRMGVIKHTTEYLSMLPELKMMHVNRKFNASEFAKNPNYLFQAIGEEGAKRVAEVYNKLSDAKELASKGYTPIGIKALTGWEYNEQAKKWFYESDDSMTKVKFPSDKIEILKNKSGFKIKLGYLLDINHDIFKYYPYLRDMDIVFTTKKKDAGSYIIEKEQFTNGASKITERIEIRLGNIEGKKELKTTEEWTTAASSEALSGTFEQTLTHEIAHAIQFKEKFPSGTSMNSMRESAIKRLEEEGITEESSGSKKDYENAVELMSYKLYRETEGEVRARASTERMSMSPQERLESLHAEHSDVAPESRVVIYDEILSNSVESNLVDNKMLLPQKESDNIKAVYDHANNIITILKKGDISSMMHELGHSYLFLLKKYADNGNKIAKKYVNAFHIFAMGEEGKKFFQEEKIDGIHSLDNFKFINEFFARSFESYLFDGGKGGKGYKIEDINVKRLLGKFKDWLKEIYGNVKKGAINIKLTDEVRDVFESIVGNKNKLFDLETYIETKFGRFPKREDIKESDVVDMINQMKNNVLDPDTRNASMKLLHDIFSKFKRQYIGQRYKGNSRLINPDLVKLMKTPKFSTPEGFEKHLALFKAIIDNSRFKFAWQQMSRFRDAAKKSVYSKRSSNIEFYSLLMRLASVNPEFITVETTTHTGASGKNINVKAKIGELESYNRLLQTRPTDMGIADFTKRVEYYESKAREYRLETERERLQNAAEAEFNAEVGDDNSVYMPTEYEQMLLRKGREDATSKARDYAIQKGKIDITKVSESEFFGLDIADMTDAELKRYSEIIAMVSRSPEGYTVTPEMVELTNKVQARLTGESLAEEISDYWRRKLASFNYDFMRKDGSLKRSIANRLFNPYGFGALSNYNLKDALNFLDGIREDYGGAVVQAIFMPLENNNNKMRSTLNNVFTSINQFKSNKDNTLNLTEGQFHKIGIRWLLSQKPDIKISAEDFEHIFNDETGVTENVFEEAGISVDDAREILMPGDVLKVEDFYKKNKNGIYEEREDLDANKTALLEIYKKLMELRNNHIKNSIIISFGEKPEGMPQAEYEKHLKIMTNSSDLMMEIAGHEVKHLGTGNWFDAARSHVKDKRMQLLSATGNQNASASVADMLSRPIELSERELEFYGIGVSLFDRLQNGDFTNGLTMKEISDSYTKNTTSPFEAVRNYAPMLRFNESRYEGSEAYEDEAGRVRPEPIFKTRTNLSSSTQFLKARKRSVTALNTNAFQMIEKRFDQELFYMTNEPHRVFLEELYKQPQFKYTDYNKKEDDGTIDNITLDYVRNNLSVYFHRGITAGKMAIKNDEVTSKIMNIVDDFKIVALSPIRTSFAQATSGFISQANLKGTALERFNDIWAGYNDVLLGGDRVHDMIQAYAPEVAYRGLSDYDLGTERVSPTISGLFDRYYRGEFKHENGYFGELINSMKDRRAANQKALLPMIYFDRLAARATFMGAYRNFCKNHGIELNYDLPDKDAVDFAVSVVRKSQATDNELFKPGVLNGIRAQEGYNPYNTDVTENSAYAELLRKGYWNFKSFTLAEKNNIAIKMIKTFRGPDKIWQNLQEKEEAIQALAYSFAGNMLFNYSKSFFKSAFYGISMYAGYMMNINGGAPTMNDEENFLVGLIKGEYGDLETKNTESLTEAKKSYKEVKEEEITSKKEEYGDNNGFTNTGFYYNVVKSFIQQFGINELGQAGVSMLMRYLHDKSLNYNESIGVRMDKLYKQSEDLNMLGIASDVFSPEVLIGGEINSQSYVNDIRELARAITSKEYNTTPDMWMSATQFGASAAGLGVFSRLPMSYPSLHKWLQDNEMHRKKLSGYSNVSKDNVKPEVTGVINEQEEKDKINPINTDDNTEE